MFVRSLAPLIVLVALATYRPVPEHRLTTYPTPVREVTSEAPVLQAPVAPADGDLDLYLRWRSARARQELVFPDRSWALRQYTDMVVLKGQGHRALVLLPSARGLPSLARFKVAIPAGSDCELVTWVSIEPRHATRSDGVDFGIAIGEEHSDPDALPIAFERLTVEQAAEWREVRADLSPYRGETVWIVLASRDQRQQRGDWLLWGDPRVRLRPSRAPAVIDLAAPDPSTRRPRHVAWSEATVFKTYSLFNEAAARQLGPDWLRRSFPWLSSVRLFSALGGNWGPALDADYEGQITTEAARWEAGWAKRYEFFRNGPETSTPHFDWQEFDAMNDAAHRSGLTLNMNLAGAPERFTGDAGFYRSYHFNELPVVDEAGWKTYVAQLFAHLAAAPWFANAEFSLFSEPNCMWIDQFGVVSHVGFQGTAEEFARQYLWTWQAMKPWVAPGRLHLGPFVVEPDPGNPVLDNLPRYLHALKRAFQEAGEPLPAWSAFAFNVYETPQLTIDNLPSYKIDYVRALLAEEFPGREIPLRFDEFGVHPIIAAAFESETGTKLSTTRWETSWHAEMLALLADQGIERAATWLPVYMVFPEPLKAYASHLFLSFALRAVNLEVTRENELVATRAADAPGDAWVRLAARGEHRIGYLWSAEDNHRGIRMAVWNYPRFVASDARLDEEGEPREVEIRLPASPSGGWAVRVTGYEHQIFPEPSPPSAIRRLSVKAFPVLPPLKQVELTATERLTIVLRPGDLVLLEIDELRPQPAS